MGSIMIDISVEIFCYSRYLALGMLNHSRVCDTRRILPIFPNAYLIMHAGVINIPMSESSN